MRHFARSVAAVSAAAMASLALALPLAAQTNPPAAPGVAATSPASPAPATPAPEMTKDGKPKAKEVRAACRATAKGEGLEGEAKRKAVSDCFVKERPDLAGKEQCRMDGFAKGLRKEELKSFVKDCAKSKG